MIELILSILATALFLVSTFFCFKNYKKTRAVSPLWFVLTWAMALWTLAIFTRLIGHQFGIEPIVMKEFRHQFYAMGAVALLIAAYVYKKGLMKPGLG